MNLREAKRWAEYNAYMVSSLSWFVISWNEGYIVIDQIRYNRHPHEWVKIVKHEVKLGTIPKKRLEELISSNVKFVK